MLLILLNYESNSKGRTHVDDWRSAFHCLSYDVSHQQPGQIPCRQIAWPKFFRIISQGDFPGLNQQCSATVGHFWNGLVHGAFGVPFAQAPSARDTQTAPSYGEEHRRYEYFQLHPSRKHLRDRS